MSVTEATSTQTDVESSDSSIATFLSEHPRMMGVVFMAMLLLAQAGGAFGYSVSATAGP